jgi:hypothetical protein
MKATKMIFVCADMEVLEVSRGDCAGAQQGCSRGAEVQEQVQRYKCRCRGTSAVAGTGVQVQVMRCRGAAEVQVQVCRGAGTEVQQ